MNCNTTHYRANSSSVPGDPTPLSHSLALVVVWAGLFGAAIYVLRRRLTSAVICGVAVISHWVLDLVVHHPDLPLLPGHDARFGFGLWNSLPASLTLELLIFGTGVWLYTRATTAADRIGSTAFWALIVFLFVIHLANVFGAPPPSVTAVAWAGQAQWVLVLWAYWVDAHRRARTPAVVSTATG